MNIGIKITELGRAVRGKKFAVEILVSRPRVPDVVVELGKCKTIEEAVNLVNDFKKTVVYSTISVVNELGEQVGFDIADIPENTITLEDAISNRDGVEE